MVPQLKQDYRWAGEGLEPRRAASGPLPTFPMEDRQMVGNMDNLFQIVRELLRPWPTPVAALHGLLDPTWLCTTWLTWEDLIPVDTNITVPVSP